MLLYLRIAAAARSWQPGRAGGLSWGQLVLALQPASPPSRSHPWGCRSPRSTGRWQRCCPRRVADGTFRGKDLRVTPPARGHGQVPTLQTPTRSNPCAFPTRDPAAAPSPVPAANWHHCCCLCPSWRASLAGWQDAAGCLSFHAFSLLLLLSPGSSSSSTCNQLGDQHAHLCSTVRETEA